MERVEETVEDFRIQPWTGIPHRDQYALRFISAGMNHQISVSYTHLTLPTNREV